MANHVEQNLGKNENIVKAAKLTPFFLVGKWIVGILLFFLIVTLFKAIGATIRHFKTELAITNKRAGSKILDSPLNEIKNVFIEQSIWGKLLKYGAIVVSTKSGSITFKNIHAPYELYRMIMSYASDYSAH